MYYSETHSADRLEVQHEDCQHLNFATEIQSSNVPRIITYRRLKLCKIITTALTVRHHPKIFKNIGGSI